MRNENMFKRDLAYNNWHRQLPPYAYAYDIDMIEYSKTGKALMMTEHKHCNVKDINLYQFQYRCHSGTADTLGVPYFVTVYWPQDEFGFTQFYVIAGNKLATDILASVDDGLPVLAMSERRYAKFIMHVRGEHLSDIEAAKFSDVWHSDVTLPDVI